MFKEKHIYSKLIYQSLAIFLSFIMQPGIILTCLYIRSGVASISNQPLSFDDQTPGQLTIQLSYVVIVGAT